MPALSQTPVICYDLLTNSYFVHRRRPGINWRLSAPSRSALSPESSIPKPKPPTRSLEELVVLSRRRLRCEGKPSWKTRSRCTRVQGLCAEGFWDSGQVESLRFRQARMPLALESLSPEVLNGSPRMPSPNASQCLAKRTVGCCRSS